MADTPRLIEVAFPLKQASLDSVHEKNVRHGHISTLHIWPARRPLAASRAALIATLLPDPGNAEARRALVKKLGGEIQQVIKKDAKGERLVDATVGGVLHWGRESSEDMDWFRAEIRKAYGGRAPKVLDPFAGGGAIPLEAMRLGCDVTAMDINPVAWFILKCTLEYPQKLAGQTRPLPKFALESREFMETYLKGMGVTKTKKQLAKKLDEYQLGLFPPPDADLAWHVRAWGWWVLQKAKAELERFYPVVNGKPTVAYLWARSVTCKHCRATLPLLKTRWLCKKDNKRVLLNLTTTQTANGRPEVQFSIQTDVPKGKGRDADKKLGAGTMSKSGATCPCCGNIMTSEDIRLEGQAGRLGSVMTAVVVDGKKGKEYRLPTAEEIQLAGEAAAELDRIFGEIPFGLPTEPVPQGGSRAGGGSPFTVWMYGIDEWQKLFTPRQLLAIGTFVKWSRAAQSQLATVEYSDDWQISISSYLAVCLDRLATYSSSICIWALSEFVCQTFTRFALPITWDYVEGNPIGLTSGNYAGAIDWVARFLNHALIAAQQAHDVTLGRQSATSNNLADFDLVLTDPPYYDAIPYSDLMDFFYVWLRRTLHGVSADFDAMFHHTLSPKWDHEADDGELVDDSSRHEGDAEKSKATYERGMARAFQACNAALKPDGRLVIVFAHKQPDAWETLVSAIIRAGFVVDGSWPIQTEREARVRAWASAALSSSVWLVCKKRPETARPGWDSQVLEEMHLNIGQRLREYWDAGIRGPDFVWAATGPALEAYSKYPLVRKIHSPTNEPMSVSEFLGHVRRMVVDFVVGRVLDTTAPNAQPTGEGISGLDEVTTYYLLHRNDFGMNDAPIGACILYAVSCGLSDHALADQYDLLTSGSVPVPVEEAEDNEADADGEVEEVEAEAEPEARAGSGGVAKLKPWHQRKRKGMGYEAPNGRPVPLIDQIHRLMHLWKAGEESKVNDYLDVRGLRRNTLFLQVLQSLIELSTGDERALLESISNHVAARGARVEDGQTQINLT